MFRKLFKVIHLASFGIFGGALLASLVLAGDAKEVQPGGFAAVRSAIAAVSDYVVLPSLVVLLLSGMLLVVARPSFISERWLWAKVAIGLVVGAVALFVVQPAVRHAAVFANEAAVGTPGMAPLKRALEAERIGASINLALVLVATALGVARPRLRGETTSTVREAS